MVGGELVTALAEATDARIIPVDSEHSALFQLVGAEPPGHVERLVLTASGGPFRGRTDLSGVTLEEALAHPTWEMGGRITIDSATLINKGFEVIEAHHLFGVGYERIEVAVHPQSIVHALVHLNDGASLAHLGLPDMRVPISYALHYPERADVDVPTLDLAAVGELTFEEPGSGDVPLPAAGPRGRRGGGDRTMRTQRGRRGGRRGIPRRPDPVHGDRRGGGAHAGGAAGGDARPLRGPVRGGLRGPRPCPSADRSSRRSAMTYVLAAAGFAALIILHELGHFTAAKAVGDAGGAVLPLLSAGDRQVPARGDRVRRRSHPAGRLREDHRHEPGRGAAPRGRSPRLLPPAGLEADRDDRGRAGGEPADRVRAAVRARLRRQGARRLRG